MASRSGRFRGLGIIVSAVVAMIAVASACSNNGEGERCQADNGNEDCADGLTCIPRGQLVVPYNSADRCCPFDRATATTQACKPGTGTIGNNQPDGGEGGIDSGRPDTGADADAGDAADAADTGVDAAEDAPDGD